MECPFWSNQPRSRETADDEMRPSASQILPNAALFTNHLDGLSVNRKLNVLQFALRYF
jgi:hypothetical protein